MVGRAVGFWTEMKSRCFVFFAENWIINFDFWLKLNETASVAGQAYFPVHTGTNIGPTSYQGQGLVRPGSVFQTSERLDQCNAPLLYDEVLINL